MAQGNGAAQPNKVGNIAHDILLLIENAPLHVKSFVKSSRSLGQEDPQEEGMATHSNIPAWRIPWTEEPGGLQSKGWQKSDTT